MTRRYTLLFGILSAFFIFNNTIFALEKGQPILSKYLSKLESTAGKGKAEKKIGGLLKLQIQLKNSYKEQPTPERLNTMQKMGMRTKEIDKHLVFIHLKETLSPSKVSELKKIGVIVHEDSWIPPLKNHPTGYVIASMPVDRLYDLARKTFVLRLETAEQRLEPLNDKAAISIHANNIWEDYGYNGAGVKIAVLDSGLDTTHQDIPTPIIGKDYSDLDNKDDTIDNLEGGGHGSHVTGSVLGRGMLSGGTYKGMAYGADLIFLKIMDDSGVIRNGVISAVIRAAIDEYDADIITMSAGGLDKYNDGSDENSQAVDYAFSKGALVFISAGNEADDEQHYSGTVSGNSTTDFIKVDVSGNATQGTLDFYLNWFDGKGVNNDLDLSLFDANKIEIASDIFREQQGESSKGTEAEIFYYNKYVSGPATFYLKVRNNANSEQFFHIYSLDSYTTFENADAAYTVGSPAVADNAIAVASYVTRTSWTDYTGQDWHYTNDETIDSISSFSSRGPRNDGTKKPDIATPGQGIISARDKIVTWPGSEDAYVIDNDGINDGNGPADYLLSHGTSMACPIAAGAAALLMQAEPSLKGNPSQVRNALFQTASNSGTQDTTFGYGKMNILTALNYVISPTPTPTATSTPTPDASPTATPVTLPTVPPLPSPVVSPTPTVCEAERVRTLTALRLKRKKSADVAVMVTGVNGCAVEGETVTATINSAGKKLILVTPTSDITDENGQAVFTITAKKVVGKTKVTFRAGDFKKSVKVEVRK